MNIIIAFLLILSGVWALQHGAFGTGETADDRRRRSLARYELKMVFYIIVAFVILHELLAYLLHR